jgi:hydroxymethylglutaryl-CoA reductase
MLDFVSIFNCDTLHVVRASTFFVQAYPSSLCYASVEPYECADVDDMLETEREHQTLCFTVTLPSVQISMPSTLAPHSTCLHVLGLQPATEDDQGQQDEELARVVCACTLASYMGWLGTFARSTMVQSCITSVKRTGIPKNEDSK